VALGPHPSSSFVDDTNQNLGVVRDRAGDRHVNGRPLTEPICKPPKALIGGYDAERINSNLSQNTHCTLSYRQLSLFTRRRHKGTNVLGFVSWPRSKSGYLSPGSAERTICTR